MGANSPSRRPRVCRAANHSWWSSVITVFPSPSKTSSESAGLFRPTTELSLRASRTLRRHGSPRTTIRSTRLRTPSRSPFRRESKLSPTASWSESGRRMAGAIGCGMPKSRWRRTWRLRRWASSNSPPTGIAGFASGTRSTRRYSAFPSRERASSMRSRRRAIHPISVWRGGSPFRLVEHHSRSGSRGTPSRTGISYSSRRGPWGEPTGQRFGILMAIRAKTPASPVRSGTNCIPS